jgi:hypothetical protein
MSVLKLHDSHWDEKLPKEGSRTLWDKVIAFVESQKKQRTKWFLLSFVIQSVFFIPIPVYLIFYFHAPIICVIITVGLFFINLVLGIIDASARKIIICFAVTAILNLLMLPVFMLL